MVDRLLDHLYDHRACRSVRWQVDNPDVRYTNRLGNIHVNATVDSSAGQLGF